MATERLSMRKIREIMRLKLEQGLSHRNAAASLLISPGAVGSVVVRASKLGLNWASVQQMTDDELEEHLYGPRRVAGSQRPLPTPEVIHRELRRKGVTLELLHLEYLEEHPDGYKYTAFCGHYRRWLRARGGTMRHVHKVGEKAFVDYSGDRPSLVDRETGEVHAAELFVAVLGASDLTFVEATRTQTIEDWIGSHIRAFEYFGGVTALVVSDQLRSGVSSPCRYEPLMQRTYEEWARHSNTALLPARPRKPRDKAKAEQAVLGAQRWILARLRNETYFALAPLNERIRVLLDEYNDRPMRSYGDVSRRQLFEQLDERAALRPLPSQRFELCEWKTARVNIDYHVAFDQHFYSVPHALAREDVEIRATTTTIEVLYRGARVASHHRSAQKGRHTTVAEHMPKAHREHLEWTPSRLVGWAATVGPGCQALVDAILQSRPHPEQGYRSCLGILRLSKRYGNERLERACERALAAGARSYRHVDSILKHGLDRQVEGGEEDTSTPATHENVRGPEYYH